MGARRVHVRSWLVGGYRGLMPDRLSESGIGSRGISGTSNAALSKVGQREHVRSRCKTEISDGSESSTRARRWNSASVTCRPTSAESAPRSSLSTA